MQRNFKFALAKTGQGDSIVSVREEDLCNPKQTTELRLRLLSSTKLALSLNGHIRGTPRTGVPESVPLKVCQYLCWGVSRSRPFGFQRL